MHLSLAAIAAYLLGSIPFALVLVRCLTGVDVRKVGSGNVGATNASRVFDTPLKSKSMFLAVYALDFAKGFVPTWFGWTHLAGEHGWNAWGTAVLLGVCAIFGHCTSPFLGFRGGKGVATTTGVFAWLQPAVLLISLGAFFLVRLLTGQVFFGSLAIGLVLAVGTILVDVDSAFGVRWPVTALALFIACFLFYTHRSNLRQTMKAKKVTS